jgi:hypothetical protein
MPERADVRSLEQLEVLLEHSKRLRAGLLKEIEYLQLELRRLSDWIESEASSYWQQQLVVASRRFSEAQDALSRCMAYVREDERRPCTEEKKRFQWAKERRALCEEKLKTARAAASAWQRERLKVHSKMQRCRDLAEADLSVAIAYLEDQLMRLGEYASLRSTARTSHEQISQEDTTESDPGQEMTDRDG